MTQTITRAPDLVPATPAEQPSDGDRELALIWIMGGRTSADAASAAARTLGEISYWVARRTAETLSADEQLVRCLEVMLDELAAERAAAAPRLALAMAELEAQGWTQDSAREAISANGGQAAGALRKAAAA